LKDVRDLPAETAAELGAGLENWGTSAYPIGTAKNRLAPRGDEATTTVPNGGEGVQVTAELDRADLSGVGGRKRL
jgi:hypothetical protein